MNLIYMSDENLVANEGGHENVILLLGNKELLPPFLFISKFYFLDSFN